MKRTRVIRRNHPSLAGRGGVDHFPDKEDIDSWRALSTRAKILRIEGLRALTNLVQSADQKRAREMFRKGEL
ncbi:MAG: hypothetical protein RDV41_14495 [Planctomycetota bacterium]|nr:hypothetical protein [Planctomycetota bacterium]